MVLHAKPVQTTENDIELLQVFFNTWDWKLENGTGVYLFLGLRGHFHQIVATSFSYLSLWYSLIFTHLTDFFDPQRLLPGKVII